MQTRIAIEGPCGCGKTTLIAALITLPLFSRAAVLPDYVAFAGGDGAVPCASEKSTAEEIADFEYFVRLDHSRIATVPSDAALTIMDRSVHTLLAHRWTVDSLYGCRSYPACYAIARLPRNASLWPDIVIYVNTATAVCEQRLWRRFDASRQLTEPISMRLLRSSSYNEMFRRYFCWVDTQGMRIMFLDATAADPNALAERVKSVIEVALNEPSSLGGTVL